MTVAGRYLAISAIIGVVLFLIAYYVYETPGERRLRIENRMLKQQYDILNSRLDNAQRVMEQIQNRDDNFYRVMLQMDPVSDNHRIAGLNNDRRYRAFSNMSDNGIAKFVTQRVDMLERQLYVQSLSFDQIKEVASSRKSNIDNIPSVLPLNINYASISGGYGMHRDPVTDKAVFHSGLDLAATEGLPVYATANGKVIVADRRNIHGNMVAIDHGSNYESRYMHLSKVEVESGQSVRKGDRIGTVGSTGKSTGPHLHYEVRFKGEPQNPINYLFMDLTPDKYSEFVTKAENAGDIMD